MKRKNDLMYSMFGKKSGEKCKTCKHLKGGINEYRKCRIYGQSASEATDWALSWDACGLWNRNYKGDIPLVNLVKGGRKAKEIQIAGQMNIFDYM